MGCSSIDTLTAFMSFAQLRRILTTPLRVSVDSDAIVVAQVAAAAAARAHLNPKPAATYPPLAGSTPIQFTALDFLRKIGELTTPSNINLARLSASWATRRYFWAVHNPRTLLAGVTPGFRLSRDARAIDRHQKTLLSDEFGMGFAGLVAERLLQAPEFVEVDFAVSNPQQFFGANPLTKRRPDFLMWGNGTPLFVIECKGSQTSIASVIRQLRRGLEQLPSIDVGTIPKVALVIATHLRRQDTVVHVVDPSDEEPKEETERRRVDDTLDKVGKNRFVVSDVDRFRSKLRAGVELSLLRWAGQHATAEVVVTRRVGRRPRPREIDNAKLERLHTERGEFWGTASPLAPELGPAGPQLFRGVLSDVLLELEGQSAHVQPERRLRGEFAADDPRFSAGAHGTCLAVLDFDV
jgi:hypothetical protein